MRLSWHGQAGEITAGDFSVTGLGGLGEMLAGASGAEGIWGEADGHWGLEVDLTTCFACGKGADLEEVDYMGCGRAAASHEASTSPTYRMQLEVMAGLTPPRLAIEKWMLSVVVIKIALKNSPPLDAS